MERADYHYIITQLELLEAEIEWDFDMNYYIALETAIEVLKEKEAEQSGNERA